MLIPILAALISGTCFALMQVAMKRLTTPNAHPFALLHLMGYLFPLWAGLFIFTHASGLLTYTLTPQALVFPVGWAIMATTTSTIMLFLFRKFSLTEMMGYRKALVTLGALGIDILLFAQHFPPLKLASIGFLLAGAVALSHSCKRLPTLRESGILLIWCSLFVVQITLYKEGLQHQPDILANAILAQMSSTLIYAVMGVATPASSPASGLNPWWAFAMVALAFAGTAIEGFAYGGLPLAVVMLLTILPGTLFAAHDLWHGHIARSPRAFAALAALATGFALLIFAH